MHENVYLLAARMCNCQSHVDTVYQFSPDKVNVIFGDNSVGKSVFFKMVKASINPTSLQEKDRIDLIRRKTEFAQIQYIFSDNSNATCRIYRKGTIFQYQNSPEEKPIVTNMPHEKFLEKLNILMDVRSGFITNIMDGDNARLLINSNLKSNYFFLRLMMSNEDIENLMEKIPIKMGEAQKLKDMLNDKLNYVNQRLDVVKYVDEDSLKNSVVMMESCNNVLYQDIDIFKYLQSLEFMFTEKKDFSYLLQKADVLQKVLDVCSILYKINVIQHFDNELLDLCQKSSKVMDILILLDDLSLPDELQVCLNRILIKVTALIQGLHSVVNIEEPKEYDKLLECTETSFNILTQLGELEEVPAKNYDTPTNLADISTKILELIENLERANRMKELLKSSGEDYQDTLFKLKDANCVLQCPVYGEVIFDEHKCTPV